MIRFSVCVETIFNALPLSARIEHSAACGAAAIEFWRWEDKDFDAIARAKESAGVDIAAFGGLGDTAPNDPSATDAAVRELHRSIEAARQIGATGLMIHGGQQLDNVTREQQLENIGAVMAAAAPAAGRAHVSLLLEPRNVRTDFPGGLLSKTADALAIIDQVNLPNVKMLFDVYHQYVTEGSVLHLIESHIDRIGHFHVADVPGRGEPGTGALDFKEMFKLIDSLDYGGYVGLEFHPTGDHAKAVRSAIDLV